MDNATLVILLALLQFIYFTARTGLGREKFNISAPACEGDNIWERIFRVQQNTMEQLIIFIPSTLAFAYYLSARWVLIPGAVFIIARFIYSSAYVKDPKKRGPGMLLTMFANVVLLLGALWGLIARLIA